MKLLRLLWDKTKKVEICKIYLTKLNYKNVSTCLWRLTSFPSPCFGCHDGDQKATWKSVYLVNLHTICTDKGMSCNVTGTCRLLCNEKIVEIQNIY